MWLRHLGTLAIPRLPPAARYIDLAKQGGKPRNAQAADVEDGSSRQHLKLKSARGEPLQYWV